MHRTQAEARAALARIDALSSRHDATHHGVRVRCRRFRHEETRPPIVLLHGGRGSWIHRMRSIEALAARHPL